MNSKTNPLPYVSIGPLKKCKVRIFYDLSPEYPVVAVVGLGPANAGYNELEEIDEKNENIRAAIAAGARALRDLGSISEIDVDGCENALCASEGANLGLYYFDELKAAHLKKSPVAVNLLDGDDKAAAEAWGTGVILSQAQNFCRSLMENPANIMTPTNFAELSAEKLKQA